MKKLIVFCLLFPFLAHAVSLTGVGFPKNGIWYSHESAKSGETVRISTLIQNASEYTIDGTASFYAGTTLLGTTKFDLEIGEASPVSINWTATEGAHDMRIVITESFATLPNGTREAGTLSQTVLATDSYTVAPAVRIVQKEPASAAQDEAPQEPSAIPENSILAAVKEYTPDSIEAVAGDTHDRTESFREAQLASAELRDALLKDKFASSTPLSVLKDAWRDKDVVTPFTYLWMFINKLLILILKYPLVFYIAGFYLLYRIIRWIKRKFFTRDEY